MKIIPLRTIGLLAALAMGLTSPLFSQIPDLTKDGQSVDRKLTYNLGATNLRCEYLADPLGIDVTKPRLGWVIEEREQMSDVRGQRQTAYQVLVASSEELLAKDHGDLWDTGKVESDQSIQVEYAGKVQVTLRRHVLSELGERRQSVFAVDRRQDGWRGFPIGQRCECPDRPCRDDRRRSPEA